MESADIGVVDTSDVDEREDFAVSGDDHSTSSISTSMKTIHAAPLMHSKNIVTEQGHLRPDALTMSRLRHDKFSDPEVESPSPRKRIKIAHSTDTIAYDSIFSVASEASLSMSPWKTASVGLTAPSSSQQTSECMLTGEDNGGPSRKISPRSCWNPLFSPPSQPLTKLDAPDAISQPRSQCMVASATSKPLKSPLSRSLSVSTDDCSLLFSLSCHDHTTPSQRSQADSSSQRPLLPLAASSPLTPIPSPPVFPALTRSQSPDLLQFVSTRGPETCLPRQPDSPLANSHVTHSLVDMPEDSHLFNRYSLRRREARQLNPYAYDKLLYKQQLKSHPDAIVKFRSPRHRSSPRGVGGEDTQDGFIIPFDNPDEDGDYVDAGSESGRRRRRKVHSSDQSNEILGDGHDGMEAAPMEKWLPEALKGLSSSDEESNEIRKLANKIRRERKKADKKATSESRKVEVNDRKTARGRPRLFPVHKNVKRASVHSPARIPTPQPPRLLSLFSRARSEPAMTSRSPSPARSFGRPSASPRAFSHSPTSSLNPSETPGFSAYLQQDDTYHFDDHNVPLNFSPGDQVTTYPVPSSPSGPPTTSGASALPSNVSEMESESDGPPVVKMNSRDRKRFRALKRMMPAAMVARQFATVNTTQRTSRVRVAAQSSGSEAEEVPAIPGLARVRKGRYRDVEVKGDPESPDGHRPPDVFVDQEVEDTGGDVVEMLSDGKSAVKVRRSRTSTKIKHEDDVISLSDSSMQGSSSGGSASRDNEEPHQSLFDRSPPRGPVRERSLIDWMLSRKSSSRPKSNFKQPARSHRPHVSNASKLNIVTSGAKRFGEHRQILLPFVRANSSPNMGPSTKQSSKNQDKIVQVDRDTVEENKKRKKKRKQLAVTNQGLVYNVHHDRTCITSKHHGGDSSRGRTLVIENYDTEFRQALDPGWSAEVERWNRPLSPTPQPAVKAPGAPTARSRLYRRTSPRPQNEILPPCYFRHEEEIFAPVHHHIVIDMNIAPLLSGIKFGTSSYTGRGYLHELVSITSGKLEVGPPMPCDLQGVKIGPTTSAAIFIALLGPLCDRLSCALHDFRVEDVDTLKEWESVTHASSQLLSWLTVHAEDQEFVALEVALREYLDGLLVAMQSLETHTFSLTAHWFIVELFSRLAAGVKYRRGTMENQCLVRSAKQLMRRLLDVDLRPAFGTFHAAESDVDVTLSSHRAAEIWVCLMHLLPSCEIIPDTAPGHPLWHLLADLYPESSPTGLEPSEDMWRTIFSLCAISQFSLHGLSTSTFRLPAAWELIAAALKKIILIDSPEKDRQLPTRALRKRDEYISCVVSRCFLLSSQWGWRLDDGAPMFKSLQDIFRSRNFANLIIERSVPMGFLENGDVELLSKQESQDSVFEVFLKMVAQAVYLLNADVELDPKQRSTHVKKFLQIAVPVSPVPFSRSSPPSLHSLSMLVNRFNAMAVAIHLDPTLSNIKFRVVQARRCVNFRDADENSRTTCVYGMMNFAVISRHHKIAGGLEEVLEWLTEMTNILMDEYKEGEVGTIGKRSATTLIQLLIGSVRRVVETSSLDKGQKLAEYPDPALLEGPWVTRVFNPRTDLVTIQQTGVEIRMLVQSFLDARAGALPAAQPPLSPIVHNNGNQESQDEYDKLFLDINDEELLAALGDEAEALTVGGLKSKEDALCKVLDKFITPAVYRLVCKHFGENGRRKNDAASTRAADEWIDCWVGCASVLVQNHYKDWTLYMKLGQQSWEKIIDDSWRRRVGLRFNLKLLRLDPGAYSKMKDDFISVLLVAALSHKPTIEHEFMSVVLSLDGLKHPLLRGATLDPALGTGKYEIGPTDYEVVRERLIETVFVNVAGCLRARIDAESQGYVELVVAMLSTLRDIYQSLEEERGEYGRFCRRVCDMLLGHAELVSHARMSDAAAWGRMIG